jgi:hypothetical protein
MEDSFFVVPSIASPSMKKLQTENAALKAELQMTKTRLTNAEQAIRNRQEHDKQIRDSILMVRREVRPSQDRGRSHSRSHLTNNFRLSVRSRAPLLDPGNYQHRPSMRRSRVSFPNHPHPAIFRTLLLRRTMYCVSVSSKRKFVRAGSRTKRMWVLCPPVE